MNKYAILVLYMQYAYGQVPIVNTSQGLVRGLIAEDGAYYMYLGIPYGVVDKNNPFGASLPHPAFDGIFDAVDDSAVCPQQEEFNRTLVGTLDCLHLNVFVPRSTNNTPKPVLVWIYGGRLAFGAYGRFLYGPKFLVRHDIIVIPINYRVGPYGFMCTDDPRVPGNQGFKDQTLALKWVQQNIANFGGDPNKVTIQGNSAGGSSVDFHIVSNHEPRLFQQGILHSGTSLTPFPIPDKNAPQKLSRHFGLETDDIPTALAFLARLDPLDVTEASMTLGIIVQPCIEQAFDGVQAFINHNWMQNNTLPLAKHLNIMIGFNNDESVVFTRGTNESVAKFVRDILGVLFDVDHEDFNSEMLRQFYFGDEESTSTVPQHANYLSSDVIFVYPSMRSLYRYLKNGIRKVYLFMFSYCGNRNFVKHRLNITDGGAAHADEIGYLFDMSIMEEPNKEDQLIVDRMTKMWTNFIKYGYEIFTFNIIHPDIKVL